MNTNKTVNQFTDEQYYRKLNEVENLAVRFAKSGMGYPNLRSSFNELLEGCGANDACNHDVEQIRLNRRIVAERIGINTLGHLSVEVNRKLLSDLKDIANNDVPGVNQYRGVHRK